MVESFLEKCLGWLCCFILMGLDFSSKITSAEMSIMSIENNAIFAIFYSKSDVFMWKMIHIVAASSHALSLKDFNVEEKR